MKLTKKTKIILAISGVLVLGIALAWTSQDNLKSILGNTKSSESSFRLNGVAYDCSQPIEGEWSQGWDASFQPEDQEEFQKFCRVTSDENVETNGNVIIEYRAVIDILRKDHVREIIDRYDPTEAWVRALSHDYIKDKEYLNRILPSFNSEHIDCIIVVHSPESTLFFVEVGETHHSHDDHQYIEVPADEFLTSLNSATDEDITAFWLGLR